MPPGTALAVVGSPPVEARNTRAVQVLDRVKAKLNGTDFKPEEELEVPKQVARLIDQATNLENLCQHYIGKFEPSAPIKWILFLLQVLTGVKFRLVLVLVGFRWIYRDFEFVACFFHCVSGTDKFQGWGRGREGVVRVGFVRYDSFVGDDTVLLT